MAIEAKAPLCQVYVTHCSAMSLLTVKNFSWVYTRFETGMREGYSSDGRLLSRFRPFRYRTSADPTSSERNLNSVIHIPSGRKLTFQYETSPVPVTKMTDPGGKVYTYNLVWGARRSPLVSVPAPSPIRQPRQKDASLVRSYEFHNPLLPVTGTILTAPFLKKVSESGQTLLELEFMNGSTRLLC